MQKGSHELVYGLRLSGHGYMVTSCYIPNFKPMFPGSHEEPTKNITTFHPAKDSRQTHLSLRGEPLLLTRFYEPKINMPCILHVYVSILCVYPWIIDICTYIYIYYIYI